MEFIRSTSHASDIPCDALVIPVAGGDLSVAAQLPDWLPAAVREAVASLASDSGFSGKAGAVLSVATLGLTPARRLMLAGVGQDGKGSVDRIARGFGAAARAAREAGVKSMAVAADGPVAGRGATAVAGILMGLYDFSAFRGTGQRNGANNKKIETVIIAGKGVSDDEISRGRIVADAVSFARDLVNEPAASLTPASFAERAEKVAAACGLSIEVLGPQDMERIGAHAILGVGKGSAHPPRLIRMTYRPENPAGDRVVGLVGKCITFDTGGYSIKTHDGMLEMKGDMAGGAAVLAVMSVLSALRCPLAVDATNCAAENMISGTAFRPSDILTA
ncbi:MAG: leucyl aminopeptidase family protein, partial [Thermomicrobiales bacterium]